MSVSGRFVVTFQQEMLFQLVVQGLKIGGEFWKELFEEAARVLVKEKNDDLAFSHALV